MADHFVATFAGHCSLGLVPPTVPTRALGWEFSQNIEARSQLKNLELIGKRKKRKENT